MYESFYSLLGAVNTNFGRYLPAALQWAIKPLARVFFLSPEQGAQAPVHLATSPDLEGVSGKYFDRMNEAESSSLSHDEALATELWDRSQTWIRLFSSS